MANAAKLAKKAPVRAMLVGYPGSGKTGCIASLVNAGYKIRALDFDGNFDPLIKFSDPEKLVNVDIQYFEDKVRMGRTFEPAGIPTAFKDALTMMDHWKYTDTDGTEVDLGHSKDWGCDTVVVLDNITSMGNASLNRAMNILNKTPLNFTQQGWGLAQKEQEAFIHKLTSPLNKFHVLVLAHLKMIAPKDVQQADSDITKQLKERAAEILPTRLYPSALGQALPQTIGAHFPTLLLCEVESLPGNRVVRKIKTVPRPELDLKFPTRDLTSSFDLSDGLAKIFEILAPPLADCVNKAGE